MNSSTPKRSDPRTEVQKGIAFLTPGNAQTPDVPLFINVRGRVSAWPQCCGAGIIDSVSGYLLNKVECKRRAHDGGSTFGEQHKQRWDESLKTKDLSKLTNTSTLQDIQELTGFDGWFAVPEEVALAYLLEKVVMKAERKPVDGPFYGGETFGVKIWGLIDSYSKAGVWPALLSFKVNTLIKFFADNPQFTTNMTLARDLPSSYGEHYLQSMTMTPNITLLKPWVEARRQAMLAHVKRVKAYKEKNFPKVKETADMPPLTSKLNLSW